MKRFGFVIVAILLFLTVTPILVSSGVVTESDSPSFSFDNAVWDYKGFAIENSVIVFQYSFTNKTESDIFPARNGYMTVQQNGVSLDGWDPPYENKYFNQKANIFNEVQAGATTDICFCFELNDTSSPIDLYMPNLESGEMYHFSFSLKDPPEADSDTASKFIWSVKYYVDEFGLPTEKGYIATDSYFDGTMSNSAVQDKPLYAAVLVNEKNAAIILLEYQSQQVKSNYRKEYSITILDKDKRKHYIPSHISEGGDRLWISETYRNEFLSLLANKAPLTVLVVDDRFKNTKYLFTIEADETFTKSYNELFGEIPEYYFGDEETEELYISTRGSFRDDDLSIIACTTTNLPDGCKVLVTLTGEMKDRLHYYSCKGEAVVHDGFFALRYPVDEDRNVHSYYKETYTIDMSAQDESVRKIIGDNLQKYTGSVAKAIRNNGSYETECFVMDKAMLNQ